MTQGLASLDSLGITFATDKSSWGHDYLGFYEAHFAPLRYKPIKLLEIGVAGGGSLKVWENYFLEGTIVGADINPAAKQYARPRVHIEIIDQSDTEQLVRLGVEHGPFDTIIDDGSHMWEHQIIALKALFPFLNEKGIYIVEDLQTNYGAYQPGFRGTSSISCMDYLKKLVDARVADAALQITDKEDAFISAYGRKIRFITFYKEACLIQNGYRRKTDGPLVRCDHDLATGMIYLHAHIGAYGDKRSNFAVIRGHGDMQNIQGVILYCNTIPKENVSYRVRYQNGMWSDWVHGGNFAGTRGRSEDLTGFSVRLTGRSREEFDIMAAGEFRGMIDPIVAGMGEDCVPNQAVGKLWGLQIILTKR